VRFLADESCDFAIVRRLQEAGYEVLAVSQVASGADDERVIELAVGDDRILLTEDKDFGELVYVRGARSTGVMLFRYPSGARDIVARTAEELARRHGDHLRGRFIVVEPGRARIGPRAAGTG
jgi:predicted nuclease of predicted toxin-antitoxin system